MGICQVALRSKDIIVGRAEKGRAESGWSMGELPGSPSFQSRVVVVGGAESLCEKLRDEMGKGVRGQIIMDFVFLLESLRFIVSSAENS